MRRSHSRLLYSGEAPPDVEVTTGAALATGDGADLAHAKPAIEVTTDFGVAPAAEAAPPPSASASACAVHRDAIELGLSRGRNATAIWQDLVDSPPPTLHLCALFEKGAARAAP